MKTLALLRHGKSSWEAPELADFDRPLLPRGEHDAALIGDYLAETLGTPDLMLASPARRARETARIVAGQIGYAYEAVEEEPRVYEASADTLLTLIQGVDDRVGTLLMIGHNPGFSDLAARLAREPVEPLPTCGVALIEFGVDGWRYVGPGLGHLCAFERPKHLRD
jgi:phosphohistidine phosphatase